MPSTPWPRTLSLGPYSASHASRHRFQDPASAIKSISNYFISPIALQFRFFLRRMDRDRPQFIILQWLDHDPLVQRYALHWHLTPPYMSVVLTRRQSQRRQSQRRQPISAVVRAT